MTQLSGSRFLRPFLRQLRSNARRRVANVDHRLRSRTRSEAIWLALLIAVFLTSATARAAQQAFLRSSYQSWAGYGIENLEKHEPCPLQSLQPFPVPDSCFPPGPYEYTSSNGVFRVSIHSPLPTSWNDSGRQYTESTFTISDGRLVAEGNDEAYTYSRRLVSDGCNPSKPYNFAVQQCGQPVPDKNAGVPLSCPVGNPINQATGNKFHVEVDTAKTGSRGLKFKRVYNHTRTEHGFVDNKVLGYGWTGTYLQSLHVYGDDSPVVERVLLKRPDGKQIIFMKQDVRWLPDADTRSRLEELLDVNGVRAGWRLSTEENTFETYNVAGRLEQIYDLSGNVSTLVYKPHSGRLDRVLANTGEFLSFGYDAYDRISSISDHANRQWRYRYSHNSYKSNLAYVDNPDGTSKQYHYEDPSFPHALTGITDERGVRYATYAYDEQGRANLSTRAGNVQRVDIVYNTGNTRTVTNSLGQSSTHTTAVQLGVALVTDISGPGCYGCGGNISYHYDPATNNLLSRTDNGITTEYGDYDAKGQYGYKIEAAGTPEQRRFDYSYDSRFFNKITRISGPSVLADHSRLTTYRYDDFGNLLSQTIKGFDPNGNSVSRTTSRQYDGPLHQLSQIDGPRTDVSDITTYRYYPDDVGQGSNRARLREIEDANGILIRSNIQYSATGKVLSESRPDGLTLIYSYYPGSDRLETLTESDGSSDRVTHWTYLATGEVASITTGFASPAATTLSFGYDDARRLTRITDGLGNYFEYTLDTEGNRTFERVLDNSGSLKKQLSQTFDVYNRLDTTRQANELLDYNFAPDGTLGSLTDGGGAVIDFSYDALKRLTQVVRDRGGAEPDTADTTSDYGYDVADRLISVTDPNRGDTRYAYDDLGNLISQTSPDTGATTFRYDAAGNVIARTDAKGQVLSYSYDTLNRPISLDAPGIDDDIRYEYDTCSYGLGRICRVTKAPVAASPVITNYSYTAFGDVSSHQGVGYSYDNAARLSTVTYPSGSIVAYSYDTAGQVSRVELTQGGQIQILASALTYQPFGPLSEATFGNGLELMRQFDAAHRPESMVLGELLHHDFGFDANGHLTELLDPLDPANDHSFTYDALYRLSESVRSGGPVSGAPVNSRRTRPLFSSAPALLAHIQTMSNETAKPPAEASQRWLMTAIGNAVGSELEPSKIGANNRNADVPSVTLPHVIIEPGKHRFSDGNWPHAERSASKAVRRRRGVRGAEGWWTWLFADKPTKAPSSSLFRPGRQEFVYDRNGNRTQLTEDRSTSVYEYEPNSNRLSRVAQDRITLDANGNITAIGNRSLVLSAHNRIIEVFDGDVRLATYRYNSLGQRVEKDTAASHTLYVYSTGGQLLGEYGDDGKTIREYVYLNGEPLVQINREGVSAEVIYLHTDHLGTPRRATDSSGTLVWSWDSDAFGATAANEDPDGNGILVTVPLRFPGQYYDQETGLHYNYFRYYDPSTGSYLTSDSIGLLGGINTYLYALANPINVYDPIGAGPMSGTAAGGFCLGYTIGDTYNVFDNLDALDDEIDQLNELIDNAENACSLEQRPEWYREYIDRLERERLRAIEEYLRRNGNMLPGQIRQAILCGAVGGILGVIPFIP